MMGINAGDDGIFLHHYVIRGKMPLTA